MDYRTLAIELQTDPLALGYAAMTDQQVADSLNAVNRVTTRDVVPAYEVIESVVPTDWAGVSAANKQLFQTLVSAGEVKASGTNTRAILGACFAAGTQTRANLLALQDVTVSRATELGLGGHVWPADVREARAMGLGVN